MEVSAVDKNIFMFSFKHEADVRRAWDRRPWTVKGEHLVLKRFSPDISVSEVDFSFTEFWIQIHGFPLNRRSKENVLKIGSMAGRALDTDLVFPWKETSFLIYGSHSSLTSWEISVMDVEC